MRRASIVFIALTLAPAAGGAQPHAAPAPAPQLVAATTFLVSGRGWGHGVGMSQYGALGLAGEGRSYAEILAHFYPGTELAPAKVANVRVLLVEGSKKVTVASEKPFRVRDGQGATHELPAGPVELGPRLAIQLDGEATELQGPLLLLPRGAPLTVNGLAYRGQLVVSVVGGKLQPVNVVGLESYLRGVVAREMPSDWHEEALKAQAVAARSYAIAHRRTAADFELYADVRSQVYGGIAAEHERTTAAVKATAGELLVYEGEVADTFFHSTSGGRTASAADVWGTAVPYLVSVPDPGSALSPVHRWGPTPVDAGKARKPLKLAAPILDLRVVNGASGRARSLVLTTAAGEVTVSGTAARSAFGLRSTWIDKVGVLSLTRPFGPVVFGKTITLRGRVRGVDAPELSRKGADGVWAAPTPVAPGADGTFTLKVKPKETTSFRLSSAKGSALLRVPVAPLVQLAVRDRTAAGLVRPLEPGTTVELQLLAGRSWSTIAQATSAEDGRYSIPLEAPGTYRARVAPSGGFAEGLSGTVEVL